MANKKGLNAVLTGVFVIAGIGILLAGVFIIGGKDKSFKKTVLANAVFADVKAIVCYIAFFDVFSADCACNFWAMVNA